MSSTDNIVSGKAQHSYWRKSDTTGHWDCSVQLLVLVCCSFLFGQVLAA